VTSATTRAPVRSCTRSVFISPSSRGDVLKAFSYRCRRRGHRLLSLTVLRGTQQPAPRQHSNGPVRIRAGQRAKSQGAARWWHSGWRDSCRKPVRCVLGPTRRRGNCATRWHRHCGVARARFPPAPGRCSREAARDLVEGLPQLGRGLRHRGPSRRPGFQGICQGGALHG
jgi:hypothetical protein